MANYPLGGAPAPTDSSVVTGMMLDQAKKLNPWALPWWVALIQGLLAAGLGLLFVWRAEGFTTVFVQFLSLFLLIIGLLDTVAGLVRARVDNTSNFAFYRGLIGFLGGLALLSLLFLGFFDTPERADLGKTLLGIVAAAYGALGIAIAFMRQRAHGRLAAVIGAAIFLLLGVALLVPSVGSLVQVWLGPTLLILGIGLVIIAFVRRSQTTAAPEAIAPGTAA